jgi:hypothetical protein
MIPKNRHILGNVLEILRFPSPISRFTSPEIQFSSPKIQFSSHEIRFTQIGFLLSLMVSAFFNGFLTFFNGFPLSPTAFRISPTAFRFSSTAFCFPRNPRKSIYGEKYTKDCYSSFVFFATCSPSFMITDKQYLRDYPTGIFIVYHFTSNIDNNSLGDSTTHVKVFVPSLKPITFF